MNIVKGSFYVLFLSYKKQNIIFWSIITSIVLLSFFLNHAFSENIHFLLSISIPVYIFYSIMASKLINKTMPYFLKLGVNRVQYIAIIGLFFVTWSIVGALIIGLFHEGITLLSSSLNIKNAILIHPILLFNVEHPFMQTFLLDAVLLINALMFGLFINMMFYRFGTIGGYSYIGCLVFVPIATVIFDLYESLLTVFNDLTFISFITFLILISIIFYVLIASSLRKVPAIPA
ncbi:hypothetical protein [Solibacillus sp. FSL H8-0538]|uniref:hypothetical protein n=1 Tax=Solibacillus sp. FSL H8-0538 TaxID=2921400 RepID=UPI0030F625AF